MTWWMAFTVVMALSVFYIAMSLYDKCEVSRFKYARTICKHEGFEFFLMYYVQSFFVPGRMLKNNTEFSPIIDAQVNRLVSLALDSTYNAYRDQYEEICITISQMDLSTIQFRPDYRIETHRFNNIESLLLPNTHWKMLKLTKMIHKNQAENRPQKEIEGY